MVTYLFWKGWFYTLCYHQCQCPSVNIKSAFVHVCCTCISIYGHSGCSCSDSSPCGIQKGWTSSDVTVMTMLLCICHDVPDSNYKCIVFPESILHTQILLSFSSLNEIIFSEYSLAVMSSGLHMKYALKGLCNLWRLHLCRAYMNITYTITNNK